MRIMNDRLEEIIDVSASLDYYKDCLRAFDTGDLVISYWRGYGNKYAGEHETIKVDSYIRKYAYKYYVDKVAELEQKRSVLFQSLTPEEQLYLIDNRR